VDQVQPAVPVRKMLSGIQKSTDIAFGSVTFYNRIKRMAMFFNSAYILEVRIARGIAKINSQGLWGLDIELWCTMQLYIIV
jgi:hypothetical protein